jgi:hypothetical protein
MKTKTKLKKFRTSFEFECKAKDKSDAIEKWIQSDWFHSVYEQLASNMSEETGVQQNE